MRVKKMPMAKYCIKINKHHEISSIFMRNKYVQKHVSWFFNGAMLYENVHARKKEKKMGNGEKNIKYSPGNNRAIVLQISELSIGFLNCMNVKKCQRLGII